MGTEPRVLDDGRFRIVGNGPARLLAVLFQNFRTGEVVPSEEKRTDKQSKGECRFWMRTLTEGERYFLIAKVGGLDHVNIENELGSDIIANQIHDANGQNLTLPNSDRFYWMALWKVRMMPA